MHVNNQQRPDVPLDTTELRQKVITFVALETAIFRKLPDGPELANPYGSTVPSATVALFIGLER